MKESHSIGLCWFVSTSSLFIFAHALGLYLFLQLFNAFSDGFIAEAFNIKIPLMVAVVSGLVFSVSYSGRKDSVGDGNTKEVSG